MHFFTSNLLYYLQVDCIDSEFIVLQKELDGATDFQVVLQAHKNFLSSVLRVSMVDHLSAQEGIDRVLQTCLRFIAVCRLLQQQEGNDISSPSYKEEAVPRMNLLPVVIPPEELEAIRKDFFSHCNYLFQIIRKVDNRGFMFRLDFNNFLSSQDGGGVAGLA